MKKITALIVDDSKIMRSAVKRALDQLTIAQFEYVEAKDGEDALRKLDGQVEMMFVDWNMPRMSGLDFSRTVRKDRSSDHIPIIMVTAEKSMGKVDRALSEGGANEYITKPFTAVKFAQAISKYIDENGEVSVGENEKKEKKKGFFKNMLKS